MMRARLSAPDPAGTEQQRHARLSGKDNGERSGQRDGLQGAPGLEDAAPALLE